MLANCGQTRRRIRALTASAPSLRWTRILKTLNRRVMSRSTKPLGALDSPGDVAASRLSRTHVTQLQPVFENVTVVQALTS